MYTALMLASGVFWSITYLLIIQRGAQDRTYGMPLAALAANLSWEFIYSFLHPPSLIQHVVNLVWFGLDLVIFAELLRFGPRDFGDLSRRTFYAMVALALATGFILVYLVSDQLDHWGGAYAAFGQNLMMSALFIAMLYQRRSLRGQSMWIAVCKLLGTAFASLAFYLYSSVSHHSLILPFLCLAILVCDVIYVGLVQQRATSGRDVTVGRPGPKGLASRELARNISG